MKLHELHPFNTEAGMRFIFTPESSLSVTIVHSDNENVHWRWENSGILLSECETSWREKDVLSNKHYVLVSFKLEGFEI